MADLLGVVRGALLQALQVGKLPLFKFRLSTGFVNKPFRHKRVFVWVTELPKGFKTLASLYGEPLDAVFNWDSPPKVNG